MAQTKNEFGWTLLATSTASSSATIDFDSGIDFTAYKQFKLVVINYVPATDDKEVWMRFSTDGGSTYDTSSLYKWSVGKADGAGGQSVGTGATSGQAQVRISGSDTGDQMGNGAGEGADFEITINDPTDTNYVRGYHIGSLRESTSTHSITWNGSFLYINTTAVNGVRILSESGNIATGEFKLYGIN